MKRWLIWTEDNDFDGAVFAADEKSAMEKAGLTGVDGDYYVTLDPDCDASLYEEVEVESSSERLVIRDVGHNVGRLTVTNDAERVVIGLFRSGKLTSQRRLFYYDSMGGLDELLHSDGIFVGFAPGPRRT